MEYWNFRRDLRFFFTLNRNSRLRLRFRVFLVIGNISLRTVVFSLLDIVFFLIGVFVAVVVFSVFFVIRGCVSFFIF